MSGANLPKFAKRGPQQADLLFLDGGEINYAAPKTLRDFHRSKAKHRVVVGPVGSGKSSGMCMELLRLMKAQEPARGSKVRQTRFAVIRNTFPQLRDTTKRTWMDWLGRLPHEFAVADFAFKTYFPLADGTFVHSEVLFRALDTIDDVRKLLSLELTGAWINEAREVQKEIVDALDDRVGRFPPVRNGGCSWRGVIYDTNPPDMEHWIAKLREDVKPEGWEFFWQPGGLIELANGQFVTNPEAENLENLEEGYYVSRSHGKPVDHIRVYYCAMYGTLRAGRPVIPEFIDRTHCDETVVWDKKLPVYVGLDFGLTPAATIGQKMLNGCWVILDELVSEHMGIARFGSMLKRFLAEHYSAEGVKVSLIITGDPAGTADSQTDEKTPFEILASLGLDAHPAFTNDWLIRREALAGTMTRVIDGVQGFRMRKGSCPVLYKGLMGGYSYRVSYSASGEKVTGKPDKNRFSHVVDAAMYMVMGGGEGRDLGSGSTPLFEDWIIGGMRERELGELDEKKPTFWGVFVDVQGDRNRTYIAMRKENQIYGVRVLDSVDWRTVCSWLENNIRRSSRTGKDDVVVISHFGEVNKVLEEMRDFGILGKSVGLLGPGGNYKTVKDKLVVILAKWLEDEKNGIVGEDLIAELWQVMLSADKKNKTSVECPASVIAMALTMFVGQEDRRVREPLPSAFVR